MKTQRQARSSGRSALLSELLDAISARGRALFRGDELGALGARGGAGLVDLGEQLLSRRGEASGMALAERLLAEFEAADGEARLAFLTALASHFGADRQAVEAAIDAYRAVSEAEPLERLHRASEPRRQELIRRMNYAPGGTAALIRMREALMAACKDDRELAAVDADFVHLFQSWFNRGFLILRPIDWDTPASVLEKLIRYEAVHAIHGWEDLKNRLGPPDRRCYGFFHPRLPDDPLIFVEVAFTRDIPGRIATILDTEREPIAPEEATTAVFYSISNTQRGLAGVSFGNFLIKQVVEELRHEFPGLTTFVTLSPVPHFARWLDAERKSDEEGVLGPETRAALAALDTPDWQNDASIVDGLRAPLLSAAAAYFLSARDDRGRVTDAIARFHLGNGARLERLNMLGDTSPKGLEQSYGLMVNYLYDPRLIERNHEAYAERDEVIASSAVRRLAPSVRPASRREKPTASRRRAAAQLVAAAHRNEPQ
jgi:malonyl-CoA decarboxylase